MNGGHCYDDDTDFVCKCSPGFKGRLCESGKYLISYIFIVRSILLIVFGSLCCVLCFVCVPVPNVVSALGLSILNCPFDLI